MKRLTKIKELKLMANLLRQDVINMLVAAGSGHSAGPLGLAEIFTALYFNILNHNSKNPGWERRDRLILSNGHVCPIRYAAMTRAGYFKHNELFTLRKLNSRLQGHPSRVDLPGLELSAASLGQGLGVAVGMALAANLKKQKHRIYCLTSDGEHDEGSTWEAINAVQKYHLNNLVNIIDRNNIQVSGNTETVWPLDSLKKKYLAFNWDVLEIDGHDFKQILTALNKKTHQPLCIIAKTIPGKGVSFMENKYEWHGRTPDRKEAERALAELTLELKKLK